MVECPAVVMAAGALAVGDSTAGRQTSATTKPQPGPCLADRLMPVHYENPKPFTAAINAVRAALGVQAIKGIVFPVRSGDNEPRPETHESEGAPR